MGQWVSWEPTAPVWIDMRYRLLHDREYHGVQMAEGTYLHDDIDPEHLYGIDEKDGYTMVIRKEAELIMDPRPFDINRGWPVKRDRDGGD